MKLQHRNGYKIVSIVGPDGARRLQVHRLVLLAFAGPPPAGKPYCLHRDGTRDNNHISNLRWGSQKENMADCVQNGRVAWDGAGNGRSKLTEDAVAHIRKSKKSAVELGDTYGVHPSTIYRVRRGISWRSPTHREGCCEQGDK